MKVENYGIDQYDFKGIAPCDIIRLGHPTLHQKAEPFKDPESDEAKLVIQQLLATIDDFGPVCGIAAPQINLSRRAFLYQVPPHRVTENEDTIGITTVINPTLEPIGPAKELSWEGCLSMPDFLVRVHRFKQILISYWDIFGVFHKREISGFEAKVFQHEFDHLEGIMHIDRAESSRDFGYAEEMKAFHF